MINVGDNILVNPSGWSFKGKMVDDFDNHLKRSVPLYEESHELITGLSDFFVKANSINYELGSSTGTLSYKLAKHNEHKNARFIGIEIEEDMVKKANQNYQHPNLEYVLGDVIEYDFDETSFIVSYYCLQFISIEHRQILVKKIFDSLKKGGAFVLFEKIRADDAQFQDITTALYNDFKLRNDYTLSEVLAKSISLKGVLEPFTTRENITLLKNTGFSKVMTVMKYITFEGYIAFKK